MCSKKIYTVDEIREITSSIAQKYQVNKMWLFGSYAKGLADEDSDVDLIVEIGEGMGLEFCSFCSEMEEKLGKEVDVITTGAINNPATRVENQEFIENVLEEEVCIYE